MSVLTQVDKPILALTINGPAGSALIQEAMGGAPNGVLIIVRVSSDFTGWLRLQQDIGVGIQQIVTLVDVAWWIPGTNFIGVAGNTILDVPPSGLAAGFNTTFAVAVPNAGSDTYLTGAIQTGTVTTMTLPSPTPFPDSTQVGIKVATGTGDVYLTGNTSAGNVMAGTARYIR